MIINVEKHQPEGADSFTGLLDLDVCQKDKEIFF